MSSLRRAMVRLTEPQWAALKAEADRLGIPVNELLRRIVDAWCEAREREE